MAFPGPGKFGPRRKKPGNPQARHPHGRPEHPQLQPTNDFVGMYERPQGPPSSGGHQGRHGSTHFGGARHSQSPRRGGGTGPRHPDQSHPRHGGQQHVAGGPGRHANQQSGHRHPRHPGQRPGGGHPGQRPGGGHPGQRPGAGHPGHRQATGYPGQRPATGFPGQRSGSGVPRPRPVGGFPGQRGQQRSGPWVGPPGAGRNQRRGKGRKKIVFAARKKKQTGGKMDSWVSDRSGSWSSGG
jgi:translation initiation factor IF-2